MKNALQYARFEVFRRLLGPFSAGTRKARMAQLETVMGLKPGMRVMDLGERRLDGFVVGLVVHCHVLRIRGCPPDGFGDRCEAARRQRGVPMTRQPGQITQAEVLC
mgnify:CR=1 FL=1